MKKKLLSIALIVVLTATLLAGCGEKQPAGQLPARGHPQALQQW